MTTTWGHNQLIAHNLATRRRQLGLSQGEAAEQFTRLSANKRWTKTSIAQAEGSVTSTARIRRFTAGDLIVFAQALDTTVTYFLTPPQDPAIACDSNGITDWDSFATRVRGEYGRLDIDDAITALNQAIETVERLATTSVGIRCKPALVAAADRELAQRERGRG